MVYSAFEGQNPKILKFGDFFNDCNLKNHRAALTKKNIIYISKYGMTVREKTI